MVNESEQNPSRIEDSLYLPFLSDIISRIKSAQYAALRAVNKELVSLYRDLGQLIVQRQKEAGWGKAVVERLARDLQFELPGVEGYSSKNLWRMRQFYEAYAEDSKLSPLVREIAWSHNLVILGSCKDSLEREFYIRMTKKHGWSKNVLIHQVEGRAYERTLTAQTNFKDTLPAELQDRAALTIKDEYTFGFLALSEEHEE